jgi:hypothetical protein
MGIFRGAMNDKPEYIDRALVKLHREYGRDELVATLRKQLSEANIENGKLRSEVDRLEDELSKVVDLKEAHRQAKIEAKQTEFYKAWSAQNAKQLDEIRKLRRLRDDLMSKCAQLENKIKL